MPTNPSNVAFPLGAPVVTGTQLTVDTALTQPTRITRRIADISLERFFVNYVFQQSGGVSGGAVVYDQAVLNELYTSRDVERVLPGEEFPVVTGPRQTPKVAQVEKWGGKFFVTDEARDRNDISLFNNLVTQLANTIVKKVNTRAVEVLEASISSFGGALTYAGHSWSGFVPNGSTPTVPGSSPAADLYKAQYLADLDELGVVYDTVILHPLDAMNLRNGYQRSGLAAEQGNALENMLGDLNLRLFVSPRVTQGNAYIVAAGQVGGIRIEQPMGTETWREQETQQTWVQTSVRPVLYVTNPYSVRKITGIG